jgi:hypothetical protein
MKRRKTSAHRQPIRSNRKLLVLIAPTAIYVSIFGLTARAEPLSGVDVTVYDYRTAGNTSNASPPLPTDSTPIAGTLVVDAISHSFDAEPYFGLYEDFLVRYTGHITSPIDGPISFYAPADDGIKLSIDGTLVIDDWYDKGGGGSVSAPIVFTAAESKTFELYFYENGGGAWLEFYWNLGEEFELVPASAFTRQPVTTTTTTSTVPETTIPDTTIPETTVPETSTTTELPTTTSSSSTTSSTTTTTQTPIPVYVPPATTSSTTTTEPPTTTTEATTTTSTVPETTILETTIPRPSTTVGEPSTSTSNAPETLPPTSTTSETLPEPPIASPEPTTAEAVTAFSNPETLATLTTEQAEELLSAIVVEDLTQQLADRLVDTLQDAPDEIRAVFENEIDVYSGLFDRYVPIGSAVPVSTRRTLTAVSGLALATAASVRIRR